MISNEAISKHFDVLRSMLHENQDLVPPKAPSTKSYKTRLDDAMFGLLLIVIFSDKPLNGYIFFYLPYILAQSIRSLKLFHHHQLQLLHRNPLVGHPFSLVYDALCKYEY